MAEAIPRKVAVRDALFERLRDEAERARAAAETTRSGAIHEENRAENDKDTRATEASYLARGQAMRVEDLEEACTRIKTLQLIDHRGGRPIEMSALIEVLVDEASRQLFFLAPVGGGEKLRVAGQEVVVLTPASPVGRAFVEREEGEELELRVGGKLRVYEVLSVR